MLSRFEKETGHKIRPHPVLAYFIWPKTTYVIGAVYEE